MKPPLVPLIAVVACASGCRGGKSEHDRDRAVPAAAAGSETPARPAGPDIGALLHVDPELGERLGKLFADAHSLLARHPVDPDELDHYIIANFETKLGTEGFDRDAIAILRKHDQWGLGAEALLRVAAEALHAVRPQIPAYDARREVVAAFREAYPGEASRDLMLHMERGLPVPRGTAACSPAMPGFAVRVRARYFEDKDYIELFGRPDAQLPDGALRELTGLLGFVVMMNEFDQGGGPPPTNLIDTMLERYGERAVPCLWEALRDVEAQVHATGGTADGLRSQARKVIIKLPANVGTTFFRAAAQAGWNDWLRAMPAGPDFDALKDEFADTPYDPASYGHYNPFQAPP